MPKKKKTNILNMMDHLEFVNMSVEGAALFKSMADSIRSALEKGILLERLIVKEKIDNLNRNYKDEVLERENKKKACESNATSAVLDGSRLQTQSSCSQNNGSQRSRSVSPEINGSREGSKSVCSNKSDNQTKSKLIKLVDSSLLFKSNEVDLPTSSSIGCGSDSHGKCVCNQFTSNSPHSSLSTQGNQLTSEPNCKSLETAQNELESRNNHNLSGNSTFTSCSNQANNNPDQPVMPSPIVIKSENTTIQDNNTSDDVINVNDSNWNDNQEHLLNEGMTSFEESETIKQPHPFQIFFTVSKDVTEGDMLALFKKLDIIRFSMIQSRPSHNFGFVAFSSEEHKKIAIGMNQRVIGNGTYVSIRPYIYPQRYISDNYDVSNRNEKYNTPQIYNKNSYHNKEKKSMVDKDSSFSENDNNGYNASDNVKKFKSNEDQPNQSYNRNNSLKRQGDFNDMKRTEVVHPRFTRGKSLFYQNTKGGHKNFREPGPSNQRQEKMNKRGKQTKFDRGKKK